MRVRDRSLVYRDLLPVIADSYPNAEGWLQRRMDDVLDGAADCLIARDRRGLRAVAIQTPKGRGEAKLSTIWVAERARGRGLGAKMIARCRQVWRRRETEEVWVTVSPASLDAVLALLLPRGFVIAARMTSRYKPGQTETVLRWTPEQDTWSSLAQAHRHLVATCKSPGRVWRLSSLGSASGAHARIHRPCGHIAPFLWALRGAKPDTGAHSVGTSFASLPTVQHRPPWPVPAPVFALRAGEAASADWGLSSAHCCAALPFELQQACQTQRDVALASGRI
jgi:ribosomal protein S18 acetylase RimI-like enzyme